MDQESIRNFAIIAHIDHGKSTLADRFLELTGTVAKDKLKPQYLDQMDLERERGITIKLQPVRMRFLLGGQEYILNLIDTPGHVDFSYEVSRSLAAVEGVILLVDATKGIQAQTLAHLSLARQQNLKIIPVINKIDLPSANIEKTRQEINSLLGFKPEEIFLVSAKLGQGVEELLKAVVEKIPPPQGKIDDPAQALVFDSFYDPYKGVIAYVRVVNGYFKKGQPIKLMASGEISEVIDLGYFSPQLISSESLSAGEIGYLTTGLKSIRQVRVGDTIGSLATNKALEGYQKIKPFVFASFFDASGKPENLKECLAKLQLNDAALEFSPENSPLFGAGFRCGFLGLLHLEITKERLLREYGLDLIITSPSVAYQVKKTNGEQVIINNPASLPPASVIDQILEPFVKLEIITPSQYLGPIMELVKAKRGIYKKMDYLDQETLWLEYEIPLSELVIDFYDRLKALSSGYASLNYEFLDFRPSDLVCLDILVAGQKVEPLSQIVPRSKAYHLGREMVSKLKEIIPRQLFKVFLQAAVGSKILAREDIPALKKDVTGHLYGGDITRKMKLWEKQKKGKKRMKKFGQVDLPTDIFIKLIQK